MRFGKTVWILAFAAFAASGALAQEVSFKDPTGDDKGPGAYVYPTDGVYKPGSFDLTGLEVKAKGDQVDLKVSLNSNLEDPWGMKVGFAVQMVFIFIGHKSEMLPHLARHMDVNALSLAGVAKTLETESLKDSAVNVKRTRTWHLPDYFAATAQGLDPIRAFVEIKTTWHPVGW